MGQITEDIVFTGTATFTKKPSFATATFGDGQADSASPLATNKTRHRYRPTHKQPNSAATTETVPLFRCYGAAATVVEVACGSIAIAAGAATVTVDIKKNGSTILTGVLTLDTANTAYVGELAAISSAGLVAGDVLTAVLVATAGGGTLPTGVYVIATIDEDPT